MRILQLAPNFSPYDAIGREMACLRSAIEARGIPTGIYTEYRADNARLIDELDLSGLTSEKMPTGRAVLGRSSPPESQSSTRPSRLSVP